jgi:hypothetical protein
VASERNAFPRQRDRRCANLGHGGEVRTAIFMSTRSAGDRVASNLDIMLP